MTGIRYKRTITYITAMFLSLPDVAIIGVVILYPVYGMTGTAPHPFLYMLTFIIFYLIVCSWALYGSQKTTEVIYRICRFGSILSLLLPVSTAIVSVFWTFNVTERPDDFLPGFSAFEIPVYAAGLTMLLVVLFLTGSYLAARDMEGIPF